MLQEYKTRLKTLAQDPEDTFLDHLSLSVGSEQARVYGRPLRDMVLTVPAMMEALQTWSSDGSITPPMRRIQGYILSYLFHGEDLVAENVHGLFGYLDDAFLAALAFQRAAGERAAGGRPMTHEQADIARQVGGWLELARRTLPDETRLLESVLNGLLMGDSRGFASVLEASA